jgi:NAD(P)-dependent dehydrogenase (short-subunit alcohol dehydrogenase family)
MMTGSGRVGGGQPESRVALVTGGTGALGRAVVRHLMGLNHRVHIPWIAEAEVEGLHAELDAHAKEVHLHRCDVAEESDVLQMVAAIEDRDGPVSILANIVGGFAYGSIETTGPDVWDRMIRLNATTAYVCSRAVIGAMKRVGWGRIVNVAAVPALSGAGANMTAYSAGKAAVLNFTTSLAEELKGSGITVNAIVPSIIDTPANRRSMPEADRSTWLSARDIAAVVAFLVGPDAGIVTGTAVRLART